MENELKRLIELLNTTDPKSDSYRFILENLSLIIQIFKAWDFGEPMQIDDTELRQWSPVTTDAPQEASVIQTEQPDVIESKPEEESTSEEDYIYTKESFRDFLTAASKAGIKIQPIMAKYIPEGKPNKFSSVPFECYEQLAKEINDAR